MTRLTLIILWLSLGCWALVAAPEQVSDDVLYDRVRVALSSDREVGAGSIEVKVSKGEVELNGDVKTERMRTRAERVARRVKGVSKVNNQLRVTGTS